MANERPALLLRLLSWLIKRLRPREGWLSVLLIAVIAVGVSNAVVETRWVADIGFVWLNGLVAAMLATLFAKHLRSARLAWSGLVISGIIFTAVRVGQLFPPLRAWRDGSWQAVLLAQCNTFMQRLHNYWERLHSGAGDVETLPFTLGIGLLVWILVALLTWQTFRVGQPTFAATLVVSGVAIIGYFSRSPAYWLLQVLIGALGLLAYMRFVNTQQSWHRNGVDYPANITQDFAFAAALFAVLFPLAGYATPRLAVPTVARAFAQSRAVLAAERVLERTFPGVDVRSGISATSGQGVGVLPRQHLLSGSPELLQSVVMTATVQGDGRANHWRALSYDIYTGRGWEISAESSTELRANRPIPHPPIIATTPISQTVHWLQGNRLTRYSLGRSTQFDQPTTLRWHGRNELVRVHGEGNIYQVQSQVSVATAEQLRQVGFDDLPSGIIDRYTQLPATIPQRVFDLAEQVTANAQTPYDKAKALETFLRQYEYSLAIDAPPAEQDVVDFFLFEQQVGYCDYYASAMTVLARHIGLPARTAIGFAAAPTIDGTQALRGIDAHSWTEIHFGDYGWIEFEPTGGFTLREGETVSDGTASLGNEPVPPIPLSSRPLRLMLLLMVVAIVATGAIGGVVWLYVESSADDTRIRFAQLQRHAVHLTVPLAENQTPLEFLHQFERCLESFRQIRWLEQHIQLGDVQQVAHQLTYNFIALQYGEANTDVAISNRQWRRTRWILRMLRGVQLLV